MRVDMSVDMLFTDMVLEMCLDMCMDMCMDLRMNRCIDMCMDVCASNPAGPDIRLDLGRLDICMYRHVCRHTWIDMYTDVCIDMLNRADGFT